MGQLNDKEKAAQKRHAQHSEKNKARQNLAFRLRGKEGIRTLEPH